MARKRKGNPIHGWLVIDKPEGITSTRALSMARRLLNAEKAGHGGTLDPIATGVLPLAFGEATKTVSWVMDGRKTYRFRLRWGEQRTTDDREGEVIATHDHRPTEDEILEALPSFLGDIEQVPPQFSAIKVDGERAYDLARDGEEVELASRIIHVESFELVGLPDRDQADFEVVCGKGTYMRSLARDLALKLGTVGHVAALRRLAVGKFTLEQAISLDELAAMEHGAALERFLLPIETALDDIPALALTEPEAHRMRHGQSVALLRRQDLERLKGLRRDSPAESVQVLALHGGRPVALAHLEGAEVHPVRLFNL